MKFVKAACIAAAVLIPTVALAQSSSPVTREQVRADLLQLENAGYNPLSSCTGDCPGSLRRAEAIVTRHRNDPNATYGAGFDGTEQAGE
ncbi:DUF4148 domain-containing protein [Caballeronia sordidicola]|uniref:DUF4148 domain-containing protein n=1 Tax=Caballeronia sordidicola TaxID=196367 RepID=UPI00094FBDDC